MSAGRPGDPVIDLSFWRQWQAEILPARPLILPPRHFVYPREAEEVERGALELLVRPLATRDGTVSERALKGHDFSRAESSPQEGRALAPAANLSRETDQPFLATCALGFRDAAVPTGIWSCPAAEELCAVSGGYAYILDTSAPERM